MTTAPLVSSAPASGFTVDPWDPGYGFAFGGVGDDGNSDGEATESSGVPVNLEVETQADAWAPIDADPEVPLPPTLLFCDGVRRIDARVWVYGPAPQPAPAIAASYAAGLVCCDGSATIVEIVGGRGLFSPSDLAADIVTPHASYPVHLAPGGSPDQLSLALQTRLIDAEVRLALEYRATHAEGDDLLVVDGPLLARTPLPRTVGYIKTHHAAYLPSPQADLVGALAPGQRTPVFTLGPGWTRHSWYLRLPGGSGAPWSGVVRLECSANLPATEAVRVASATARALPPLASVPYKDPRAPQNLVPIGGLERALRHRLGDPQLLYRALRAASYA